MNVFEAIQRRHAVRAYKPDPVPTELLRQLLECARRAPSAVNMQPWKFIAVTDQVMREKLKAAAGGQSQVSQAPVVLVCLADEAGCDRMAAKMEAYAENPNMPAPMRESFLKRSEPIKHNADIRKMLAGLNSYIAIAYLTLAAKELGLDTCWMTGYDESEVKKLLNIPQGVHVVSLLTLGYAAEVALEEHDRLPFDDIVYGETYGTPLR
ncbi:nitroreductase family protein [Heliobacterium chlorum]|uniref:Nitroreductase family protein n=1 Tax=Heliobacterium chlorum TaxID=2698 RepID=A0ABR7T0Y0_HELCL|nr:nitroreductase family protein [Heliobacterium chlorum]MBC9783216.1 nitroreductase family protein [Heliobacterium chlorum]